MGGVCTRSSSALSAGIEGEEGGCSDCCPRWGRPAQSPLPADLTQLVALDDDGAKQNTPGHAQAQRDAAAQPQAQGRAQLAGAATGSLKRRGGQRSGSAAATSVFETLYGRYLPFAVRQRFLQPSAVAGAAAAESAAAAPSASLCRPLLAGELECFEAAVSFIDVSGFTGLSEHLARQHGAHGAEILNDVISQYFNRLIDVIVQFGGDVLKFAGDAMLVMWRNKKIQPCITLQPEDHEDQPKGSQAEAAAASAASPSAGPAASPASPSRPRVKKNVSAYLGGSDGEPLSALVGKLAQ